MSELRHYLQQLTAGKKMLGFKAPKGYCFTGVEDFVLQEGESFSSEPLTDAEMEWIFEVMGSRRFAVKQCYFNAQILLNPWTPNHDNHELLYVEGYATGSLMPVQHGWLTLNGKVIDLTLRMQTNLRRQSQVHKNRLRNRVLGEFPQGREYLGVTFQTEHVCERIVNTGMAGTIIDDWQNHHPLLRVEPGNNPLIMKQQNLRAES